jgi:hypothetical protein
MVLDVYRGKAVKDGKKCRACGAINPPGAFGCRSCHSDVEFAEVQPYPESGFESQQDKISRSKPLYKSGDSTAREIFPFLSFTREILTRLKGKLKNTRRRKGR